MVTARKLGKFQINWISEFLIKEYDLQMLRLCVFRNVSVKDTLSNFPEGIHI